MKDVNLERATINILIELDGKVHMVGMSRDNLDAITMLIKQASEVIVPTGKTQNDLLKFLGR